MRVQEENARKMKENSPGLWPNGMSDPQYFVLSFLSTKYLVGGFAPRVIGSVPPPTPWTSKTSEKRVYSWLTCSFLDPQAIKIIMWGAMHGHTWPCMAIYGHA